MKIIRHLSDTGPAHAVLQSDGSALSIRGNIFGEFIVTEDRVKPGRRLAPLTPPTIIGIGLNYRRHAEEGGKGVPSRPMWFMKSNNTIQDPDEPVVLPASSSKVDYEGELAVVIGKSARNVLREDAMSHVFGYTIANDISARDWQFEWGGGQFCHAKSFDTFCPLGPLIVTADEIPDPQTLRIRTNVGGKLMQDSGTADMVFDVASLICFLSEDRTLSAGTVILTGTPSGVGYARKPPVWLAAGDIVSVEIDPIGILNSPVMAAEKRRS